MAWRKASQHMLRISIEENIDALEIKLEGRVAGPWAAELGRVWMETAPRLASRKLVLDLSSVTYADAAGTQALSEIYAQTHAEVLAGTVWTQSLAEEITRGSAPNHHQER
jgi:anti-anti-sigma regulatory factor